MILLLCSFQGFFPKCLHPRGWLNQNCFSSFLRKVAPPPAMQPVSLTPTRLSSHPMGWSFAFLPTHMMAPTAPEGLAMPPSSFNAAVFHQPGDIAGKGLAPCLPELICPLPWVGKGKPCGDSHLPPPPLLLGPSRCGEGLCRMWNAV